MIARRLYVGGLPLDMIDRELKDIFTKAGKVEHVDTFTNVITGKGEGFGIVDMSTEEEAAKAIRLLDGFLLRSKKLVVNRVRNITGLGTGGAWKYLIRIRPSEK